MQDVEIEPNRRHFRLSIIVGACLLALSGAASACGDGILEETEQCDDGNTMSGDGCSAMCRNEFDFGDAPAPFPTLLPTGARHTPTGPTLGVARDSEDNGQPDADASGDGADEDGITSSLSFTPGVPQDINLTISNATGDGAFLNAWVDFDNNGIWTPPEQVAMDDLVTNGSTTITDVTIPVGLAPGTYFARIRICSFMESCNTPTGAAKEGEVEDYAVTVSGAGGGGDSGGGGDGLLIPGVGRVGAVDPFILMLLAALGFYGWRQRKR